MSIINDLDAEILGGGTPIAKFPEVGDIVRGTVAHVEKAQQTEFGTGTPLTWDDGTPRWQFIFTLDTEDGPQRLFARGAMWGAIKQALREAGGLGDFGGTLTVKRIEDGEPPRPGYNPPKQYRAKYEQPKPKAVADLDDFM